MSIEELLFTLGPGVGITYLHEERPSEWHCELTLPRDRFTVPLLVTSGTDADAALMNAIERAGMFRVDQRMEDVV